MREPQETADKEPIRARRLTLRQNRFVELVVSGHSHADAYRCAYRKPAGRLSNRDVANGAYRVANKPGVKARIAELQTKRNDQSRAAALLTLNERLGQLAEIMDSPDSNPSERIRAIAAYTRLAGDGAPRRRKARGSAGTPLWPPAGVDVSSLPLEERIAMLQAAKAARGQAVKNAAGEAFQVTTRVFTKQEKCAAMKSDSSVQFAPVNRLHSSQLCSRKLFQPLPESDHLLLEISYSFVISCAALHRHVYYLDEFDHVG
jgi:hypothetical protein